MRQTQTKQRVLVFLVSGLPESEVYTTIMGKPGGLPRVAGVNDVHLRRWDPHVYVVIEPDVDVDKVMLLIEHRFEALRVHKAHQELFEKIDGSVTVSGGVVKTNLSDKLRFVLGSGGMKKLVDIVKTLDIDERSLAAKPNGFVVKPSRRGVSFHCRLRDDIRYYLDLILASRLMRPDARRLVRID